MEGRTPFLCPIKMDDSDRSRRNVELRGSRPPPPANIHKPKYWKKKIKPVVIYVELPKVIHAEAGEFMALVQRLTGLDSSPSPPAKERPPLPSSSEPNLQQFRFPRRVKARVLTRSAAGKESSAAGISLAQTIASSPSPSSSSSLSPALFLHDSNPDPWSGVGGARVATPAGSWLQREDFTDWSRRHATSLWN